MPIDPRTPVITGIGITSPFGLGKSHFYRGIAEGRSVTSTVSLFSPEGLKSRVVGEVKGLDPLSLYEPKEAARVPRIVPMAVSACKEALADAGIDAAALTVDESRQIQVIVGSGAGGVDFAERQYELYYGGESRRVTPYAISSSFVGMLSSEISIYFKLRGAAHVVTTGCTSSTDAMGYASRAIRHGDADIVVTGGAEACITHPILAGFDRMQVTSTAFNDTPHRASRPFNKDRDGFVLGEGAWILVMESYERAKARGAKMYGFVRGYGSTCDAYHRVLMTPDGEESSRAIRLALESAKLDPAKVDYVNLHGTSTQSNDKTETLAVKKVFGERAYQIPMSATKSMIGHPQGACGAAGVSAALLALNQGIIHPTANYEVPDPECDLNYVPNKAVNQPVQWAVTNCIAFGSKNSALVLEKAESHTLV
ncbi:MAG: beta-ketoacyl-[acyl-carrier-protein] synthase family protein [Candidatus Omnitrophica bacterium]|nr:beta-ketoacyl-[acyl-carrier-protein] synthase family protein [Candidatus Omnitrophota bacterium]